MMPAYLEVLDELPTQAERQGRPRAAARAQRPPAARGRPAPSSPAEGELEEQVAAVWAEAFGLAPAELSVDADFFDRARRPLAARRHPVTRCCASAASAGAPPCGTSTRTRRCGRSPPTWSRRRVRHGADRPRRPRPGPLRSSSRGGSRLAGTAQAAVLYAAPAAPDAPGERGLHRQRRRGLDRGPRPGARAPRAVAYLGVRWLLPAAGRPAAVRRHRARAATALWGADLPPALGAGPGAGPRAAARCSVGSPLLAPYLRLLGARVGRRTPRRHRDALAAAG